MEGGPSWPLSIAQAESCGSTSVSRDETSMDTVPRGFSSAVIGSAMSVLLTWEKHARTSPMTSNPDRQRATPNVHR